MTKKEREKENGIKEEMIHTACPNDLSNNMQVA